jgi:hypothetical protein
VADAQETTELAKQYSALLEEEGYEPAFTEDGEGVKFKCEGNTFVLATDADDPKYFRIVHGDFWSIDDAAELNRAVRVANIINCRCKLSKVFVVADENVGVSVELLVDSPPQAKAILRRALGCLNFAQRSFRAEMLNQSAAAEGG